MEHKKPCYTISLFPFSSMGIETSVPGTLVSLVTDESLDKVYARRPKPLSEKLSLPILFAVDPSTNTVLQFACPAEWFYVVREFRQKVMEELSKLNPPFYGFYGEFYQNVISTAMAVTELHYVPNFVDLRRVYCKNTSELLTPDDVRRMTRSKIMAALGITPRKFREITGADAMRYFGAYKQKPSRDYYDFVETFVLNGMHNDVDISWKLEEKGWLEKSNSKRNLLGESKEDETAA